MTWCTTAAAAATANTTAGTHMQALACPHSVRIPSLAPNLRTHVHLSMLCLLRHLFAGVAPDAPAVAKYGAEVHYGRATPGLLEIEPSTAWNPATLGGIGVVVNPEMLFDDMHTYLELAGEEIGRGGQCWGGSPH